VAVPPTIPTSFVPKQPLDGKRHFKTGTNYFLIIALAVLGIAVIASGLAFGYEYYLKSVRTARANDLTAATAAINEDTVEEFVRLRDRLVTAHTLLDKHVVPSRFFLVLDAITLQSVRFSSLEFTVADNGTATIEMEGAARSFNALAAQSAGFAAQKDFKRAIFSDISVNPNNSVSFRLTAEIDSDLLRMPKNAPAVQQPQQVKQPVATSTPAQQATSTATSTRP
jgi:hypothetical protein